MRILLYIAFVVPILSFAQLTTSGAMSPPNLVQNVLLGTGVQVSNINYTGDIQAIGSFNFNGANLGLNQGIVITTGTIFNTGDGPQGPNGSGGSGIDNSGGSSAILNGILGSNNTFNAAVLEFDFQAQGDLVSFNYIFGSEEYLEYVNAGFNDVFGLFISGPNPGGGNYVNQNIAKLPNQTIVSIDNVNDMSNSAFYVDNGDGSEAPFNSSAQFIQYDGYTRVLTAASPVQCGQTYHLTIAIADVGDGILDSGIFLEAQSLTSEAPTNIDVEISQNFFGDESIIAEGCTSADFVFSRTNTDDPINVQILVSGTAQNGADYTNTIPQSLNLAAGQSSASFTFDAIVDGITEGLETIEITFQVPNICNGVSEETFTLQIQDVEPITVSLENDTIFCNSGPTVTLTPVITGGLAPITYSWSTNQTTPSITVSPNQTTSYTVTATDFCLNSTASATAEIYIPPLVPIVIQPIASVNQNCPFIPETFTPVVSGGASQYSYIWLTNNQQIGTASSITITPAASASYSLIVFDQCGAADTVDFDYTIQTILLIPSINQPTLVCPGDSVLLSASATLGFGAYVYSWSHTEESSADVWVNPLETTTYSVSISDACQTYSVPISTVVPVREPLASFSYNSSSLEVNSEVQFFNTNPNSVSFSWDLGNGETSNLENPGTSYSDLGEYIVTLIAVDDAGCIDTTTRIISIGSTLYIPNTFTPDGNRHNNEFFAESFNIQIIKFEIFNRWGELIYESYNDNRFRWDGNYKGKPCQDGVYTYKIRYRKPNSEEFIKTGHINVLR
ncbi:MAG: choice-of-anchor L domain-containing protein [Flavobacteriia bacterium]|jgi:gliding motility-associated-like protein